MNGNVEAMLYVCYVNLNSESFVGVKKKILAQCRVFEKEFGVVYYTMSCDSMMYLFQNDRVVDKKFAVTKKICNEVILGWIEQYIIKKTYIRYNMSSVWFLDFLEQLKIRNIKSVLEFPSIPYDGEGAISVEDKYYREQLHSYINCCTTYTHFETVFNIPCITLANGVDIEEQREKRYREKDGTIVLVAVASHAKWHGYERVIQGLNEYYKSGGGKNIIFNIVGNGPQIPYYHKLTEQFQLSEHVNFCGQLMGEKLDEIYDNSDIAIGVLGLYKKGVQSAAPIKLGEYCAKGIPFVYGYNDLSVSNNNYFACQVSNDETPIDMQSIIAFYESMYDGRDFIKDMRRYTLSYLTWNTIMQPVIDYLS